jgi:hypothetical protein
VEERENNSEISFNSNYIFYFSYIFSLLSYLQQNTSLFIALDITLKIHNKNRILNGTLSADNYSLKLS